MPENIALDVHAHIVPLVAADGDAFKGLAWDHTKGIAVVDGHPIGMKPLYRPGDLVAWMDLHHIETAWISAPPPLYRQHLDDTSSYAWASHLTAGFDNIASERSGRLAVLAHLPLDHPAVAVRLATERLASGERRFSSPAGGCDLILSDPSYESLWTVLNDAGAFLFMHPGACADGRLATFYLSNLLGNPHETTVAIAHLIFGGVIERFPNIRFCFAHGGGAAAAFAGRFQQGFETDRPDVDTRHQSPRSMLRHICVDCITHDDRALDLSASVFGDGNVIFGSDWPFPMGLLDPHRELGALPSERRRAIFCDNPMRLLAATASRAEATSSEKAMMS